jgi:hypothetical protein
MSKLVITETSPDGTVKVHIHDHDDLWVCDSNDDAMALGIAWMDHPMFRGEDAFGRTEENPYFDYRGRRLSFLPNVA